ncbi:Uncharacterised protein [Shigella sonnei]|nr:Uncharacterised protein [Shigella sonnei]
MFRGGAAEQGGEEVIRVPVIASPAHHYRLMFAIFRTLEVLTPFVGDDFGLHAHFRPVCLNHLRHAASVRVIRTLYRHRPQVDGETFFQTRFFQQGFRFFRIVGVILNVVVIAPHGWRDQVFR